jgi:hypothetical protein
MPEPSVESFARLTLARLGLVDRISADPAFRDWRAEQARVTVDGRDYFVMGGDMLLDEPELMLNWAVEKGLAPAERVHAAEREILAEQPLDPNSDMDFIP